MSDCSSDRWHWMKVGESTPARITTDARRRETMSTGVLPPIGHNHTERPDAFTRTAGAGLVSASLPHLARLETAGPAVTPPTPSRAHARAGLPKLPKRSALLDREPSRLRAEIADGTARDEAPCGGAGC